MLKSPEILYIDDEANNLISFKATFRYRYPVYTAINTDEAREILRSNPNIRIIFCDQRMPGEMGIDFLHKIKHDFPRPIRILLTAYADMETVVDAVNKGHIFRFVRKPWVEEEIISSIEEANKFYITNSMLDIRNEELQKAYDELDKFAYSVSHDLRDPLTGVLSAIKLALEFDSVDRIHEILALMESSVLKLNSYINSLHDYYLLKRGELTISEISFESLFEYLQNFYSIYTRNHNVEFVISSDQKEVFKGDETALKLILHNLLSNAFKYQKRDNDHKMVKLSVVVEGSKATIQVSDTGIGIAEQDIGEIFKLFFRGSDQAEGTGFGLYNVKSALAKLQGEIAVTSVEGEGTTFTVVIPSK
ncbi:hybrid sensor histidine kinase/response regulator [Parapedobacter sp. ISTM3]|uniref:histidine kinase n=1 Tax=Parapedobacter luteus TaxID=623280 RepID=A0A1T5BMP6_9SPHI|nr:MULTISPECIES: hybrid sensor histidine kinase/response regulator [Parapedobacter]MBK1439398.1 hybrid sensor histidine kinase/response regulator [Parapedobacter sp. ISTM3]SKB48514.1 Signal transduction histidine kinase [Parapedobacter luteus]